MRPLRKFEKRLEKIFEEPFTRAFKGGVHPLEIARRLTREIDDAKMLGVGGTLAPNQFIVRLSPRDYERLSGAFTGLGMELESLVITHTNQRGYHLITRPRVEFQLDDNLREGDFLVAAALDEPTKAQPSTQGGEVERRQARPESLLGLLTIVEGDEAGRSFNLEMERTRIGRAEGNDLVLNDPRASRFHAEIEHTPAGYIIRDLGSTNGTMVRGRRVSERLLEDGDTLVVGGTGIRFDLITGRGAHCRR